MTPHGKTTAENQVWLCRKNREGCGHTQTENSAGHGGQRQDKIYPSNAARQKAHRGKKKLKDLYSSYIGRQYSELAGQLKIDGLIYAGGSINIDDFTTRFWSNEWRIEVTHNMDELLHPDNRVSSILVQSRSTEIGQVEI